MPKKNMAPKAGGRKTLGVKGESLKNSFNFCIDGIDDNAKSLPESQKPAFLTFKNKFTFSPGRMPPDSTFQGGGVILNILGHKGGRRSAPPPPKKKKLLMKRESSCIYYRSYN